MSSVENCMNRITDVNSSWWPFLFLRPEKSRHIDNRHLLKMSVYFGSFYGAIVAIVPFFLRLREFSLVYIVENIVAITVLFFFFYKYTFALSWNRRACRLQEQVNESKGNVSQTPFSRNG